MERRKQTEGLVKETIILETNEHSKTALAKATKEDPEYSALSGEVDVTQTDYTLTVAEIPVAERPARIEEVHPLSLLSGESHSHAIIEDLQSVPIASIDNKVLRDNHFASESNMSSIPCSMQSHFPFVKTCPMWKEVESMEVFHAMPQHPHFQPLQERNEFLREGDALGYMINFANVAHRTNDALIDEPKSYLENKLNALPELEGIGLSVQPIRTRLLELLQFKDSQEQRDEDLQQYNEKLIKEKDEGNLLELELNAIDEKLRDLEESLAEKKREQQRAQMEKQSRNSNIVALLERRHAIKEKSDCTRLEFSCIAANPL